MGLIIKRFSLIITICENRTVPVSSFRMEKNMGKQSFSATGTLYRTVRQYSSGRISPEDMKKLLEVAADCRRVKEYVYARYGGTRSLAKLYPGYSVQNEMTESGLRMQLGLPSVYFYLSVFEALGDIKAGWSAVRTKAAKLAGQNERLTDAEKHYLRFALKTWPVFAAIMGGPPISLPKEMQAAYESLAGQVDTVKLEKYLRRQVRRYHVRRMQTSREVSFPAAERAYRYEDHGIYISTKEKRKRVFVPLTDNGRYSSQIRVCLFTEEGRMEILAAVKAAPGVFKGSEKEMGISLGMGVMLTTDGGSRYGMELGERHSRYADWIREQAVRHSRDGGNNPGRKKYQGKKSRMQEDLHGYINRELNRFLTEENPGKVYMMEPLEAGAEGRNRRLNHRMTLWERGYVRRRLEFKCRERGVDVAYVCGRDIAVTCSRCGGRGVRRDGLFTCGTCGHCGDEKANSAGNALQRGLEMERKRGKAGGAE